MKRFGIALAASLLTLVAAGCGDKKVPAPEEPAVIAPVRLSVTASRPAGTLDSLPDLTWTLSGGTGLSLVVRAQGPGPSAPGVGFAGVMVASGPVRYLAADGTWSEAEVVYAAAAGAGGTIRPTAPLRLEGEWRFDLLVKDAGGMLKGITLVPVVLSATPALRVALSQQAAAVGDLVEGTVTLASGASPRPVRLLAWWQGPGGLVEPLPSSAPLAFDGTSENVRLPLLARRLDGAAPGTWTLVARLYDAATGAPLGYGAQSMEVCGAAAALSGTVLASAGAPLGSGASHAKVQALGMDRPDALTAPIDSTGAFSLPLAPGHWMLTATVVDGAGAHEVDAVAVQVGCGAPAPVTLRAQAPVPSPPAVGRAGRSAATASGPEGAAGGGVRVATIEPRPCPPVSAATARSLATATTCSGFGGKTRLRIFSATTGAFDSVGAGAKMPGYVRVLKQELEAQSNGDLIIITDKDLVGFAKVVFEVMANGVECSRLMDTLDSMITDYYYFITFTGSYSYQNDAIGLAVGLVDVASVNQVRLAFSELPFAQAKVPGVIEAALGPLVGRFISSPGPILTYLRDHLQYPLEPRVSLTVPFAAVTPGQRKSVTVNLKDCDGTTYPGRTVYLTRHPTPFPGEVSATTDASGNAQFAVDLGAATFRESLQAHYVGWIRIRYYSEQRDYGVNRGQLGQLRFSPGIPAIRPTSSAAIEVTSQDPATGAPQPGKTVALASDLGGLTQETTGTTDAAGAVAAGMAVGGAVGLGQVVASLPVTAPSPARAATLRLAAAAPPEDPSRVTHYLAVTSPVALNVQGPPGDVPAGAVVVLNGSLQLDGLPLVGTTIQLTTRGPGTLEAGSVVVDQTGGFEATFRPPASGSGASTVTLSVVVEGQTVTKEVRIGWIDEVKKIAFVCLSAASDDLCVVNPDGTGLVHLTDGTLGASSPAWSGDGSRIAFSCYRSGSTGSGICVINADGTGLADLRPGMSKPSWSPDGSQIAVDLPRGGGIATFVAAESSGYTPLPVPASFCQVQHPSWSSGGPIAFVGWSDCTGQTGNAIYSMNPDGSGLKRLTSDLSWYATPSWSRDGGRVAFTRSDSGSSSDSVWVMQADGSGQVRLSEGREPTWSPDGSQLAFFKWSAPWSIWVVNADGSSARHLADGISPSW